MKKNIDPNYQVLFLFQLEFKQKHFQQIHPSVVYRGSASRRQTFGKITIFLWPVQEKLQIDETKKLADLKRRIQNTLKNYFFLKWKFSNFLNPSVLLHVKAILAVILIHVPYIFAG